MDTAKAVAHPAGLPLVIVPTIASTDAPTSALSGVYDEEGAFKEYRFFERNPDAVIVDTALIARAPVRFPVAGIGDGLSTYFEAEASSRTRKQTMAGGAPTRAALAIARLCYDTLLEHGLAARLAVEQQSVTPAVEKVVEANTLLSGLGFESGGLAAAHSVHNGLTALEGTHHYWHGEKVAFGVITMLMLEDRPAEVVEEVVDFCPGGRTAGRPRRHRPRRGEPRGTREGGRGGLRRRRDHSQHALRRLPRDGRGCHDLRRRLRSPAAGVYGRRGPAAGGGALGRWFAW